MCQSWVVPCRGETSPWSGCRHVLLEAERACSQLLSVRSMQQPVCSLGLGIFPLDSFQITLIGLDALKWLKICQETSCGLAMEHCTMARGVRGPKLMWGQAWSASHLHYLCAATCSRACCSWAWGHCPWGEQMSAWHCWADPSPPSATGNRRFHSQETVWTQLSRSTDVRLWPQPSAVALDATKVTQQYLVHMALL